MYSGHRHGTSPLEEEEFTLSPGREGPKLHCYEDSKPYFGSSRLHISYSGFGLSNTLQVQLNRLNLILKINHSKAFDLGVHSTSCTSLA